MQSLNETLSLVFPDDVHVLLIVGSLLILCSYLGYRMGLRVFRRNDEVHKAIVGNYPAIVLSILGLLLGFTFAMAVARFDARRVLVVEEANSIGTTYLRASFLPPAQRERSRELLREYVDLRLELRPDRTRFETLRKRSGEIQRALWQQAEIAAAAVPGPILVSYLNTLNQTIDLESARLAASRAKIPGAVWIILLTISLFAMWSTGYSAGTSGRAALFPLLSLPLLITLLITLVVDLTRPEFGIISVDHRSLQELRDTMEPAAESAGP